MAQLDPAAADNVHYATDPRIRHLAEAAWRMRTGGTRMDWLMLGKDNPDALISEAREWVRAAVAGGIIPPPSSDPAWKSAAHIAANADEAPEPQSEACGKCKRPFEPRDLAFDGHARYHLTPYCRACVDLCHDNEIADHRCVICA